MNNARIEDLNSFQVITDYNPFIGFKNVSNTGIKKKKKDLTVFK